MQHQIRCTVNGVDRTLLVPSQETLLLTLSRRLGLCGAREVCGLGVCGACTVLVDGAPISSCTYLAAFADGSTILTIEGMAKGNALHPLQEAFIKLGASQCGYCTPGMILSAKALLDANPRPTETEIRRALAGNLCRCTGYNRIIQAVQSVIR
ncbi:MAG: (2Fe-2S)-binding protein [Deltaproteobacteria bacterium]|nr:(2Fe-2S)-binding protein [Deltaproteobacteria bacterium]